MIARSDYIAGTSRGQDGHIACTEWEQRNQPFHSLVGRMAELLTIVGPCNCRNHGSCWHAECVFVFALSAKSSLQPTQYRERPGFSGGLACRGCAAVRRTMAQATKGQISLRPSSRQPCQSHRSIFDRVRIVGLPAVSEGDAIRDYRAITCSYQPGQSCPAILIPLPGQLP